MAIAPVEVSSTQTIQRARPTEPQPLRWTKEQYHQMGDVGLFTDKRVELIEGEIIEMAAMNLPHWKSVIRVHKALLRVFGEGFTVIDQLPISIVDESEPEPDVAVIRGNEEDLEELPSSALLVIEISDATLIYDQGRKLRLYAKTGIPEYWILNLNARHLEVYREPKKTKGVWGYRRVQIIPADGSIAPLAAPETLIAVADLLPRQK